MENFCQTCIITSLGLACGDKVKQHTDTPFMERIPADDIGQSQPLTQENPNKVGEEVTTLQDFSEVPSSENSIVNNEVDNGQNKEEPGGQKR